MWKQQRMVSKCFPGIIQEFGNYKLEGFFLKIKNLKNSCHTVGETTDLRKWREREKWR